MPIHYTHEQECDDRDGTRDLNTFLFNVFYNQGESTFNSAGEWLYLCFGNTFKLSLSLKFDKAFFI